MPLQCPPDDESAGVEVEVGPAQPERLALPEPEGQRDGPAGAVASVPGPVQQALRLGQRERLDLGLDETPALSPLAIQVASGRTGVLISSTVADLKSQAQRVPADLLASAVALDDTMADDLGPV